ncbi:MAG TPA: SAM-dependent methyltransferase, partial [Methylotenera sp.]|nr:SAM-dependent methyltransferase [Methylotenera sp.]
METLSAPLKIKKRAAWLQTFAKKQVLKKLANLAYGQLTLIDADERYQFGNAGDLTATIIVND